MLSKLATLLQLAMILLPKMRLAHCTLFQVEVIAPYCSSNLVQMAAKMVALAITTTAWNRLAGLEFALVHLGSGRQTLGEGSGYGQMYFVSSINNENCLEKPHEEL